MPDARSRAYYGLRAARRDRASNLVYDTQRHWRGSAIIPVRLTVSMAQRTADAISQYQYTNRLPVDGQPSPQLLNLHDPVTGAKTRPSGARRSRRIQAIAMMARITMGRGPERACGDDWRG